MVSISFTPLWTGGWAKGLHGGAEFLPPIIPLQIIGTRTESRNRLVVPCNPFVDGPVWYGCIAETFSCDSVFC